MITKGQIQVCIRLKDEVGWVSWGSFVWRLYFKYLINLKTFELGVALLRFPLGYAPGGNRILIADYRPA